MGGKRGVHRIQNWSVEFEEHVGCSSGGIQCATGKAGLGVWEASLAWSWRIGSCHLLSVYLKL